MRPTITISCTPETNADTARLVAALAMLSGMTPAPNFDPVRAPVSTADADSELDDGDDSNDETSAQSPDKPKRGRPRGSKNKPKDETPPAAPAPVQVAPAPAAAPVDDFMSDAAPKVPPTEDEYRACVSRTIARLGSQDAVKALFASMGLAKVGDAKAAQYADLIAKMEALQP